jgi:single-strand DNA-binding protein
VPQLQGQKMENEIMYENKVQLIGYLGKNPEHKTVKKTGRTFAILSLATQSAWKDANEEWQRRVEWHRLIAWNGLGEYAASKLKKGDHLYVEGMLVSST